MLFSGREGSRYPTKGSICRASSSMRYIDNGTGDPREEAPFSWLREALLGDVVGIRWQSGYFEASVLGLFMPVVTRNGGRRSGHESLLIGSNERETLSSAVHRLVDALGLPRENAHLGVVSYSNGFFHPKTIYLCYRDGREAAYVWFREFDGPGNQRTQYGSWHHPRHRRW